MTGTSPNIKDILIFGFKTKLSNRKLARFHGVAANTVRKYLEAARRLHWDLPAILAMDEATLERALGASRKRLARHRLPDWPAIHEQLQHPNVTLGLLWEEYRLVNPADAYSYSQFTELYRQFAGKLNLTMRLPHRAGEIVFVDFAGTTVPYTDPVTGQEHKAQVFVACLGCSNYAFVLALRAQTMECWIEAHNRLFAFLGGTPPIIVCDNLKAAVIHAGRSPELNRTYWELAKHYGCIVVPARARHPQDKAKVEAGVLFVSRWILACLRHRHFGSLAEINEVIADLRERLNQRPFKYLPGCRRSRFLELDLPLLQPLPSEPFEYAEWLGPFKVGPDYHVPVKEHFYSVPSDLVQELVEARVTGRVVEILHKGRRIASHARHFEPGLTTTDPAHQPPAHRHYAQQTPERDLDWAKTIGPATTAVVEHQFARWHHSLPGLRACASLRALARDYGAERLESACLRAQAIDSLTVKSIRSILQRRLDSQPTGQAPADKPLPDHENLRGPDYYGRASDMLLQQTLDTLQALRLGGMSEALRGQLGNALYGEMCFEERLGLLVDAEAQARTARRVQLLVRR